MVQLRLFLQKLIVVKRLVQLLRGFGLETPIPRVVAEEWACKLLEDIVDTAGMGFLRVEEPERVQVTEYMHPA